MSAPRYAIALHPRRTVPLAPTNGCHVTRSIVDSDFVAVAAAVQTAAEFDAKAEQARAVDQKRKRIEEAEEKRHALVCLSVLFFQRPRRASSGLFPAANKNRSPATPKAGPDLLCSGGCARARWRHSFETVPCTTRYPPGKANRLYRVAGERQGGASSQTGGKDGQGRRADPAQSATLCHQRPHPVSEWSVQQALICATWCGCARQHCIYPPAPPKSPEYPQAPSQWQVARSRRFVACCFLSDFLPRPRS